MPDLKTELLKLDGCVKYWLNIYLTHIETCDIQPHELYGEAHHKLPRSPLDGLSKTKPGKSIQILPPIHHNIGEYDASLSN
jgi:hypothetical protein